MRVAPAVARAPSSAQAWCPIAMLLAGHASRSARAGYSCIAEQRMIETINTGKPIAPFLKHGDRIEIEMLDAKNHSIFGRTEQDVVKG
jgi:hypothetical protein